MIEEKLKAVLSGLIPLCGTANIEPRIEDILSICQEAVDEACKLETVDDIIKMLSKLQIKLMWLTTSDDYNNVCDFIGDTKNYLVNMPLPEFKEKL